ncbi:putative PMR5 domain, trichome birefringence-like family [Dioscorea sansibarensis]
MVDSSAAKGALERVEVARRHLGMLAKPLEQAGVVGVFSLTLLLFFLLFCCAYLDYWSFVPGGEHGFKGWGLKMGMGIGIGIGSGERIGDGDACDLIDGDWVWDDSYPLYESKDCGFLDEGFKCAENGRPDRFYSKWRWQPKHCDLPRF